MQVSAAAASPLLAELPQGLQRSDSLDHSAALSLDNIRQSLIRQEDTIIFSLIERAQFAANSPVYTPGAMPVPGDTPHLSPIALVDITSGALQHPASSYQVH